MGRDGFRRLLPRQMVRSREVQLEDRELNILILLMSNQSNNVFVFRSIYFFNEN